MIEYVFALNNLRSPNHFSYKEHNLYFCFLLQSQNTTTPEHTMLAKAHDASSVRLSTASGFVLLLLLFLCFILTV